MNSVSTLGARHANYGHYSVDMARRLDGPFGLVEKSFADRIAPWIAGKSVLDVGCGFGSLVEALRQKGVDATGIDQLDEFVDLGRNRYPLAELRVSAGGSLPFDDKSFNTVILKDTIHHVFGEGDLASFMAEVKRVCRRRIVVMDPNPTLILASRASLSVTLIPSVLRRQRAPRSARSASMSFTANFMKSWLFR